MVASYEKIVPSSLKLPLKRLRFWDNSRLLTTYGCRECILLVGLGQVSDRLPHEHRLHSLNMPDYHKAGRSARDNLPWSHSARDYLM